MDERHQVAERQRPVTAELPRRVTGVAEGRRAEMGTTRGDLPGGCWRRCGSRCFDRFGFGVSGVCGVFSGVDRGEDQAPLQSGNGGGETMAWKCGGQVRMDVCVTQHWKRT